MTEADPSQYVRQREKGARDVTYPVAPEPLSVAVYDNHAHLEIEDGEQPLSLDEQLARAAEVGVAGVVQAGGDIDSSRWSAWAAQQHPRVLAAVAIPAMPAVATAQSREELRRDRQDKFAIDGIHCTLRLYRA